MSPLWRDRIQVFFAPDRVDLVRSHRGVKPKQATRLEAGCEHAAEPAWTQPLGQLDRMIEKAAGAEMTITVSNCFMRYAVLSAQPNIATPAELHAYAAFHMREIYGARAEAWAISVSAWDPCSGGVCAAIERSLLEGLEEVTARYKIRLKYIEPYFTGAFDHWHKRLDSSRTWFALIETGRLCLGLLEHGVWQRISNQRILHNAEDELLTVLDQEAILFSPRKKAIETVYLFAPAHPKLALPENCGWRAASLQTEGMPAPPHYPSPAGIGIPAGAS